MFRNLAKDTKLSDEESGSIQFIQQDVADLIKHLRDTAAALVGGAKPTGTGEDEALIRAKANEFVQMAQPALQGILAAHGTEIYEDMVGLIDLNTQDKDYKNVIHPDKIPEVLGLLQALQGFDPARLAPEWRSGSNQYELIQQKLQVFRVNIIDPTYGTERGGSYEPQAKDKYYYL